MGGIRADVALVQQGLARSRAAASDLIKAGAVWTAGRAVTKPSQLVSEAQSLTVARANRGDIPAGQEVVSRAGSKLQLAISDLRTKGYPVAVSGKFCLDIGASTGGFTQVLLENGAARVVALDVGHGQLRPELRSNPKVTALERVNARFLTTAQLPYRPQFITCDVSFISLKLMFPPILDVAAPGAQLLLLVKPQFEVGKGNLGKGGIVRDPAKADAALADVVAAARAAGIQVLEVSPSQVAGMGGNQEFFLFGAVPS